MSNQQLMVIIGSIISIIALFVPAMLGVSPTRALVPNESFNLFQTEMGIIILVPLIVTVILGFVPSKSKIAGYIGIVLVLVTSAFLYSMSESVKEINQSMEGDSIVVSLAYGNYILLLGSFLLFFSIFMNNKSNKIGEKVQNTSVADELEKLSTLKEKGIISDSEFTQQKEQLLNRKAFDI